MAVEKVETYSYHCDHANCEQFNVSKSGRPQGWGLVRVYDNKIDRTSIGDENGWNNYDLCPMHYEEIMVSLGMFRHNIPEVPDDAG